MNYSGVTVVWSYISLKKRESMYLDVPVLAVLMNMLMLHHQWLAGYLNPADRTVDTVQVARCIQTVDHVVAFMTVLYLNGLLKRKKTSYRW